jgi:D-alanyl-D-alanine carboxypeptidase
MTRSLLSLSCYRHLVLMVFLPVAVLLLTNCRDSPEADHPQATAATSTADQSTATALPSAPTSVRTESTASPAEPGTSTPKAEIVTDLTCGELLPILSGKFIEPTSTLDDELVNSGVLPEAARPALRRMTAAPDSVGLVAFEVGKEDEGIFFNPDSPMPLASITKIINLIAYAGEVERGTIDPSSWVPVAEIEKAYLPGSDLGSHRASLAELEEAGLVSVDGPSIPMEQIPWMMMRHSSNAASDYLQMLIGQELIENTIVDLGMGTHSAPCPFLGQFLSISNHGRSGNDRLAVGGYVDDLDRYGQEVMQLTERYMSDPEFRQSEGYWRAPVSVQRYFADELNARASARDYAGLLSRILRNEIGSDYVNILVRRAFEWPMIFPVNQQLFSSVGFKSGSLPGVLNAAYYGTRLEDGAQVIVVLFFNDLPIGTYRQWRDNLAHDELARWLMSDPTAISTLKSWMSDGP